MLGVSCDELCQNSSTEQDGHPHGDQYRVTLNQLLFVQWPGDVGRHEFGGRRFWPDLSLRSQAAWYCGRAWHASRAVSRSLSLRQSCALMRELREPLIAGE